ncbi:hypothetical protein TAC_0141 [Acinetobacter phage TAC1]|nr:hypothetical protein TAC_0141 [Acinetobacter phage TAC1]
MKLVNDLIMNKIEKEFDVRNIELPYDVTSEVFHWTHEYLGKGMTLEQVADKLFEEIFSYKNYDVSKFVYLDTEKRETTHGWVLSPEGVMYHTRYEYCHGLAIAALCPVEALKHKFIAPPMFSKYECIHRNSYQDFGFIASREYGWIRFDQSFNILRIDFYMEKVTQAQIDTMKDWFKYHDLLDRKCETYYTHSNIRKVLDRMQCEVSERKLGKPPEEMILIEPDENGFGLGSL